MRHAGVSRMQTSAQKTTFVHAVRDVLRQSGVRGLYTGLTASVFRQMTYSVTRLGAYDALKAMMSRPGKKLSMGELVVCASAAGALGGLAGNPADPAKPPEQRVGYRNALHGLYRMVKDEGGASLFRGLAPNTLSLHSASARDGSRVSSLAHAVLQIRAILMNSSQLVSYDFFKDLLLTHNLLSDGMPLHLVSSAAAGTVATTICAPADVVKSRVMNAKPGGQGPVALLAENFKKEGPRFLFRGWLPAWIRLTPNTICMFVFLEQLRKTIDMVRARQ
ncbi:Dicarboxylate carrier 1 [Saitozyma sp. JCM 24511]|nr:Dicarboxylate carrier 1 [Saitozyma sp. JCM 24511]